MTPTDTFKAELGMRINEYKHLIERGIEMLKNANPEMPTTHLGHNLANIATDLSAAAARVEHTEMTLRFFRENTGRV